MPALQPCPELSALGMVWGLVFRTETQPGRLGSLQVGRAKERAAWRQV